MKLVRQEKGFSIYLDRRAFFIHKEDQPGLFLGTGEEDIDMYRGNFKIEDYVVERKPLRRFEIREESDQKIEIIFEGDFLLLVEEENDILSMSFKDLSGLYNRFWARFPSCKEEKLYGLGEQMSYFNLKGRDFPVWTSEPGVGRDKTTYMTWRSDVENKAGGDYYNSNFPQPTFISIDHYYLHLDSTAYSKFNFKNDNFTEIEVWEIPEKILYQEAPSLLDTVVALSKFLGHQPELPDWIYNGLIIGAQGGTDRVRQIVDQSIDHGIQVSGLWCQDWCGKKVTSFGRRLKWNWIWDEKEYRGLPGYMKELKEHDIKFLGYSNPYLVEGTELYQEGLEKGYFAKGLSDEDYLVDFGEFYCGVVDFTNPEAYKWFKEVLKKNMIDFGLDGWMADFGEYLPIDIKLHNGESPLLEHNRWPVLWAKCNYEALEETGNLGKILYFMRAGGTGSQKYCALLWAGDQSVDFSIHDGLISVVKGAISSASTAMGLTHSDIGGYTSMFGVKRTKELFIRWAEMAAFSPVMRTHEGNRPDDNFQYYDDEEAMTILAGLTKVYKSLSPYIKEVVKEAAHEGIPAQRPLVFHYEEDEAVHELDTQYLFGQDLLVAPIYIEGDKNRELYLPDDEWIHLWTGEKYGEGNHSVEAPYGQPPVFYRAKSAFSDLFEKVREM